MAKQSGLHQIRGKVGEHSYYKQTGVDTGLIRSINQGMSNRVKTAAEYANTRLNNSEFGHACKIAGVLGHMIMPKFRPMILPFSQSKMARLILETIKEQSGSWGQRSLPTGDVGRNALLAALNAVVKNNPTDYGITFSATATVVSFVCDENVTGAFLDAIGANGFFVNIIRNNVQVGNYVSTLGRYQYSYRVYNMDQQEVFRDTESSVTISAPQLPPLPTGQAETFGVDVAVIMPYRTISGTNHLLQEYCTFLAF